MICKTCYKKDTCDLKSCEYENLNMRIMNDPDFVDQYPRSEPEIEREE